MRTAILLSVIVLSGCVINQWEVEKAINFCKDKGGIYSLQYGLDVIVVKCQDSKQLSIK